MSDIAFGLDTFGDVPEGDDGVPVSHAAAIRQVVDEAVLADDLGVDAIALGEHHRPDYSISTPETVLAAIAARTSSIRLGSGVTVLSSDDPVRVFQRFATVDALSSGRAEVILGRGSFTESFPLFGYDLADYDQLFEEKLQLFVRLLDEKPVTWEGTTRAALEDADVFSGECRHGKRAGVLPHSRTGAVWVGICVTVLMLGLLIVFIAQNTETVDVTFLWMDGTVPLAVALLIAAAGAGLLATIVGIIRIAQLRRLNRRS